MGLLLPGPSKYRLGSDGSSPHLSVTVLFTSVLLWDGDKANHLVP